jgi:hypothetical protein
MHEELWQGIEFKLAEADFFLDRMSKALLPPQITDPTWHPAYGPSVAQWQPDFYFYLDAFIGATRSIPDVIQKWHPAYGPSVAQWQPESHAAGPTY